MQDFKQQKFDIQNEINRLDKKIGKLPNDIEVPEIGEFLKKICFYKFWWSMLIVCPILFICALIFNWEAMSDSRLGNAVIYGFMVPPIVRIVGGALYGTIVFYPLCCLIFPVANFLISRYKIKLEKRKLDLEKELQTLYVNNNESIRKYENHKAVAESASILADILYNRIQNAFQEFDTKTLSTSLQFSVQYDKIIYFSTEKHEEAAYNRYTSYIMSHTIYDFYQNHLENLSDRFMTLTISAAITKKMQQIIKQKMQNATYGKNYTLEIEHSKPNQSFEYFDCGRHYQDHFLYSVASFYCSQFVTVTFSSSNPRYQELKTW